MTAPLVKIEREWSWPAIDAMMASQDAKEGPIAFTEKRKPEWKRR